MIMKLALLIFLSLLLFKSVQAQHLDFYPAKGLYFWFDKALLWKEFVKEDIKTLRENKVKSIEITYADSGKFISCEVSIEGRITSIYFHEPDSDEKYICLFYYDTALLNSDYLYLTEMKIVDSVSGRSDNYRKRVCFKYMNRKVIIDYCNSSAPEGLINITYPNSGDKIVMRYSNYDAEDYKEYLTINTKVDNKKRPVESVLAEEDFLINRIFYFKDSIYTINGRNDESVFYIKDNKILKEKHSSRNKDVFMYDYVYNNNGLIDSLIIENTSADTIYERSKYSYKFYK